MKQVKLLTLTMTIEIGQLFIYVNIIRKSQLTYMISRIRMDYIKKKILRDS